MPPRGKYYNVTPTPENFRALWDRIHHLDDQLNLSQATILDQARTIAGLQTSVTGAADDAKRALFQASQIVDLGGQPSTLPGGFGGGSSGGGSGGTGGGGPVEDFVIPAHPEIVVAVKASLPPLVTLADIFKVVQGVAWQLRAQQINGFDFPAGLLIKNGGENVYTCGGVSYSVSRICFPNGHIIKILGDAGPGGNNSPQWVDDGFVPEARYAVATDPSLPC